MNRRRRWIHYPLKLFVMDGDPPSPPIFKSKHRKEKIEYRDCPQPLVVPQALDFRAAMFSEQRLE